MTLVFKLFLCLNGKVSDFKEIPFRYCKDCE